METNEIILWGVGLAVTIAMGIAGMKSYRTKSAQIQKTGKGSLNIQSGGDTKIEK